MKATLDKVLKWPPIAHLLAANTRFNVRLGPQFAGAVTYFSVLSLVPILMFSFAMLGMTLTVLRPDMLASVQREITELLSGGTGDLGEQVAGVVENALNNWRGIGIFALLTAAYSGSGWVGNLKKAVRMIWREVPIDEERKVNPVLNIASNIVIFLGLLVALLLGIAVAQGGSSASRLVVDWLGMGDVPGIGLMLRLASIVMTFLASWVLMGFLFLVLPDERARWRTWLVGVTIGAVGLTILQQLAGTLMGLFAGNAAAALFGPVIIAMLLMNLLATIVLMTAAWIGVDTTTQGDVATAHNLAAEVAAARSAELLAYARELEPGPAMVRQEVAERGVRAGLGVGYGVGAATGVGLGAVVAATVALVARLLGRR
ncbi:YhjD/YihY/BrkB family envelope integrity protein [Tessaracoccus oleiagri]|uniref:Membrane protein n=1 Tax=Tessaracoccus oleiagri TaxID=686624 RepID=A0A1G9MIB8_9ACTN|nr:YhjD/YihY/BrkB family envelope integrity protein [Tessaracoccus oleiagri]SDL74026.1 membrane protein [Tessaracoccus oleiagri]